MIFYTFLSPSKKKHSSASSIQTCNKGKRVKFLKGGNIKKCPTHLIQGFTQHFPQELKQFQVVVVNAGGGGWKKSFFLTTCHLKRNNQNINSPYVFSHISTQVTSENLAVDEESISICSTE